MNESTSSELMVRVELAMENIRPYLRADGGDVRIVNINGSVLKIELLGACKDCPMSATTMKAGVEEVVRRRVPEITAITTLGGPGNS